MRRREHEIAESLRERGVRPTKARCQIMSVFGQKVNHLTAEDLLNWLRQRGHKASPATVYQNLVKLVEGGLLVRFTGPDGVMRLDSNLAPHHHLICVGCGRVADVSLDKAAAAKVRPVDAHTGRSPRGWKVAGVRVEFEGVCPTCHQRR